ncbi:MAG: phosphatidylinositol mannoside acyltransferase, partial [Acidimicrobiia bacterium]|nr:phosphatidylinositol mannoside acyltransferase [Acidimicrobiia bacterium]
VAEKLKDQRIVDWFVGLRKALGIDVVIATGRDKVFETCSDALRRNAAVALLADRNLSGRGVLVSFFGEETRLPVGPARLALETGAPIVPVGSFFQNGRGHRVSIKAAVPVAVDDDVASLTMKVGRALEDLIREAPEQWHMVQPNWPSDRQLRP